MTPFQFPAFNRETSRRSFLAASSSLAAAAFLSSCASPSGRKQISFSKNPFSLGVASGDPSPDGFVIWTRLAPDPLEGGGMPPAPLRVSWQVAEDEQMKRVVRKGTATARHEWAHSVHVEVEGLRPERWYWYQFKVGSDISPVGRTRTMPPLHSIPGNFRFAFASCQHFETGYYTAFEHMLREDLDLVVHLGDYIYEGAGRKDQVREHLGPEIVTLDQYRTRYAQYKSDPALQRMHAAAPWILTWDDHEVDNNYANDISEEPKVSPAELLVRRAAAYQAYYEHMPLRRSCLPHGPNMKMYRRVPVGKLADFFVLDTRQYRTDQPCGDGNKPPCAESLDPKATLMGAKQRSWLETALAGSTSRWNILAQQVMMARVDRLIGAEIAYSMDQWPGYEMERRRLLQFLEEHNVKNTVVLTGDIHSNWANELTIHDDTDFKNPVAAEFVGTSISSGGDGSPTPKNRENLYSENPFVKFFSTERGYVKCELTPEQWRADYQMVEYVSKPGASLNKRATFILESGSSKLHQA
jgi:alkaline phosphatase D